MNIPIYISARSNDPFENLFIHDMTDSFLDDGDYDLFHKYGEAPWNDGVLSTHFEAPAHG